MQGLLHKCIACICAAALSLSISGCDSNDSTKTSSSSSSSSGLTSSGGSGLDLKAVQVNYPPLVSSTSAESITIRGSVNDAPDVTQVLINGSPVSSSDNLASWSLELPLADGLNTFAVTYESNGATSDAQTVKVTKEVSFGSPKRMVFDEVNNQFLVLELTQNAIVRVDASTGDRTIFSPAADQTNLLDIPKHIVLDSAGNRVIIYQDSDERFIAVDLADGSQTALPDTDTEEFILSTSIYNMEMGPDNTLLIAAQQITGVTATDEATNTTESGLIIAGVIYSLNLTSGDKTIISGFGVPDNNSVILDQIIAFTNAPSSDKMYVIDLLTVNNQSIYRLSSINKSDGSREGLLPIVDDTGAIDTTKFDIANTRHIKHDPASNSLWLYNRNNIVKLDIETLEGEVVSGSEIPSEQWSFTASVNTPEDAPYIFYGTSDFELDSSADFAYVLSDSFDHLLRVDTSTKTRTRITGVGADNIDGKSNFSAPSFLTFNGVNNTLYVSDTLLQSVFSVDLAEGTKSILKTNTTESDNLVYAPLASTIDTASGKLFVLDNLNQLINTASTAAPRLYSIDTESSTAASVIAFNSSSIVLNDIARDAFTDTFYTAESNYIRKWNINNGGVDSSLLSANTRNNIEHSFSNLRAITFDPLNNRLLAADAGNDAIYAIDTTTGTRTILSGVGTPINSSFEFKQPKTLVIDGLRNRALVLDSSLRAIVAVDLDSGERSQIVTGLSLTNMKDLAYIPELNYAMISDGLTGAIHAIDLETSQIVQLSR